MSKKEISTKGSEMQKLLDKFGVQFNIPKVGDTIEGVVFDVGSNAIYVDLGQLGAGVVRGEELQSGLAPQNIKIGDVVAAIIEELDNEEGLMELSFKEASMERAWSDIQEKISEKKVVNVKILGANKGGLLVEVNGIDGFLPVSQLSVEHYPKVEDSDKNKILSKLRDFVGKTLPVRILDADQESKKLIVSEKAIQDEERIGLLAGFQTGDIIEGTVSGVVDFGAFVKFAPKGEDVAKIKEEKKLEGLVHISELAWQLIADPRDIIKEGDQIQAKIISIEGDGRVSLSIKELRQDPWLNVGDKYKVGQVVKGTISRVNHFGAFADLDENIHGLVHITEMAKCKERIESGKVFDFKILSIEPETHKMGLKVYKEGEEESGAAEEAKKGKETDSTQVAEKKETRKKEKLAKKEEE